MAKYVKRVHGLLSIEDKEKFSAIQKENKEITVRYILEDFINTYCETNPKGIKLNIKEIELDIKKIDNKMDILRTDRHNLELKLKTYKDKLNETLDNYIDNDLIKAIDSILKICDQKNIESFEDIPDQIFINIAKHNKTNLEILKQEVKKEFI
jgi:hypothetical protein